MVFLQLLQHARLTRGQIDQRDLARTHLSIAPAATQEDAHLLRGLHHLASMKRLLRPCREIGRNDLRFSPIVVEDKIGFLRAVYRLRGLGRGILLGQCRCACQQQKGECDSLHFTSSYCVTLRETSSSTNEVCSSKSSAPLKKI